MIVYIVMIVLMLICILFSIADYISDLRYKLAVNKMIRAIIKKSGCDGHIYIPDGRRPTAYDCENNVDQYEFIEIKNDGKERRIYADKKCRFIRVLPWSNEALV